MITEDNNFVELITLEGTTTVSALAGNSTKFTFGGANEPIATSWMNWIIGISGYNPTATYVNNYNYLYFSSDPQTSGFSFSFGNGGAIYIDSIQVSVLLVSPLLSNNISVNNYQYQA